MLKGRHNQSRGAFQTSTVSFLSYIGPDLKKHRMGQDNYTHAVMFHSDGMKLGLAVGNYLGSIHNTISAGAFVSADRGILLFPVINRNSIAIQFLEVFSKFLFWIDSC